MFLHVLTHINTHHIGLIIKQALSQSFGKLRLTNTGRSKEQERTDRLTWIFNTSLGTNDSFGDFLNTLVLANDSLMKNLVQM